MFKKNQILAPFEIIMQPELAHMRKVRVWLVLVKNRPPAFVVVQDTVWLCHFGDQMSAEKSLYFLQKIFFVKYSWKYFGICRW